MLSSMQSSDESDDSDGKLSLLLLHLVQGKPVSSLHSHCMKKHKGSFEGITATVQ
jgi:hypothetical protein